MPGICFPGEGCCKSRVKGTETAQKTRHQSRPGRWGGRIMPEDGDFVRIMGKLLQRENSAPFRFAKEFRWTGISLERSSGGRSPESTPWRGSDRSGRKRRWDKRPWEGSTGLNQKPGWHYPDRTPEQLADYVGDGGQYATGTFTASKTSQVIAVGGAPQELINATAISRAKGHAAVASHVVRCVSGIGPGRSPRSRSPSRMLSATSAKRFTTCSGRGASGTSS